MNTRLLSRLGNFFGSSYQFYSNYAFIGCFDGSIIALSMQDEQIATRLPISDQSGFPNSMIVLSKYLYIGIACSFSCINLFSGWSNGVVQIVNISDLKTIRRHSLPTQHPLSLTTLYGNPIVFSNQTFCLLSSDNFFKFERLHHMSTV